MRQLGLKKWSCVTVRVDGSNRALEWAYSQGVTDRTTYRTEGWSFWSDWSGWTDRGTESTVKQSDIERHDWWPNRNTAERINQTETEKRKPNTPYICNLYMFFTWNMCNNVTWCTNTLFRWLVRRRAKVSLSSENRYCCCLTAISLSCPVTEHHINMINASHGQLWVLFSHSG